MLGLKLNHVSKRGHRCSRSQISCNCNKEALSSYLVLMSSTGVLSLLKYGCKCWFIVQYSLPIFNHKGKNGYCENNDSLCWIYRVDAWTKLEETRPYIYIHGLVQVRCTSSALAMELCLSCTCPSICMYYGYKTQLHKRRVMLSRICVPMCLLLYYLHMT